MSLVSAVLQSTENALVYHFNPLLFMLFIVHVIICVSKNAMSPLSKHEKTQLEIPNIEVILILNIVI